MSAIPTQPRSIADDPRIVDYLDRLDEELPCDEDSVLLSHFDLLDAPLESPLPSPAAPRTRVSVQMAGWYAAAFMTGVALASLVFHDRLVAIVR
jgi:hypothetical protein